MSVCDIPRDGINIDVFLKPLNLHRPSILHEDARVIKTASGMRNCDCFFFSVCRHLIGEYTYCTIRQERFGLQSFLLENMKRFYPSNVLPYVVRLAFSSNTHDLIINTYTELENFLNNDELFGLMFINHIEICAFALLHQICIKTIIVENHSIHTISYNDIDDVRTVVHILGYMEHFYTVLQPQEQHLHFHPSDYNDHPSDYNDYDFHGLHDDDHDSDSGGEEQDDQDDQDDHDDHEDDSDHTSDDDDYYDGSSGQYHNDSGNDHSDNNDDHDDSGNNHSDDSDDHFNHNEDDDSDCYSDNDYDRPSNSELFPLCYAICIMISLMRNLTLSKSNQGGLKLPGLALPRSSLFLFFLTLFPKWGTIPQEDFSPPNFSFSKRETSFKVKIPTNVQTPLKGVLPKILVFRKGGPHTDNKTFRKENVFIKKIKTVSKWEVFKKSGSSKLSKQKSTLPERDTEGKTVLSKYFPPISQSANMILFLTMPPLKMKQSNETPIILNALLLRNVSGQRFQSCTSNNKTVSTVSVSQVLR